MTLSFASAAAALAAGRTSARALVEEALARAADPAGEGRTVFTTLYPDAARASADAIDTLRRANRAPGPFAGIPVSIKDLFDIGGEITTAGSVALREAAPATRTAPAVARLMAAGCIPIGRTQMTEFAFSGIGLNPHTGTPRAPWRRERGHVPGGSSSGAAVSVADGMAAGALGTDTGGSCRIPAAWCGIVGWKPTQRRVPRAGAFPLAPSLDSVGSLGADVASCAALDAIIAGETAETVVARPLAGLRLVLPQNVMLDELDRETEKSLDRAVARLHDAGALIDCRRFALLDRWVDAHRAGGLAGPEAFDIHRDLLALHGERYDPKIRSRIEAGARMSAPDYVRLANARRAMAEEFTREMAAYDGLLAPTVPIAPPLMAELIEDESSFWRANALALRNTSTLNFLDGCAISIPCHAPDMPPAGLMVAGPAMTDERIMAMGTNIEKVLLF